MVGARALMSILHWCLQYEYFNTNCVNNSWIPESCYLSSIPDQLPHNMSAFSLCSHLKSFQPNDCDCGSYIKHSIIEQGPETHKNIGWKGFINNSKLSYKWVYMKLNVIWLIKHVRNGAKMSFSCT